MSQLPALVLLLVAVTPAYFFEYDRVPGPFPSPPNGSHALDLYIGVPGVLGAIPGPGTVFTSGAPSTNLILNALNKTSLSNTGRLYQGPTNDPKLVFFDCKYLHETVGRVDFCRCTTATYGNGSVMTAANIVATSGPSDGNWIFLQTAQCKQNRATSMGCMVNVPTTDAPCWSGDTVTFSGGTGLPVKRHFIVMIGGDKYLPEIVNVSNNTVPMTILTG